MRSLVFILTIIALFIGCTKIPEKTDIEEIINEIISGPEEEKAEKCGNGVKNAWEECDFLDIKSCGEINSELIGPYQCNNCKIDSSGCVDIVFCNLFVCSENNKYCMEALDYSIYCDCVEGYSGEHCDECAYKFHYDLDGSCISDKVCTLIGCGNERKACAIHAGQAVCQCPSYFKGENCDECAESNQYYEDGECKSNSCSNITCPPYEKCISNPGEKPVCVCKYETQDPTDCSKCLPGYCWDYYGSICTNSQKTLCTSNPNKPENSKDISIYVTEFCSNEGTWPAPTYCEWECNQNTYLENGECNIISIQTENQIKDARNAIPDRNNDLIAFDLYGSVYKLSGTTMNKVSDLSVFQLVDIKILPDGNYFYLANESYAQSYSLYLKTNDGREIIKIKPPSVDPYSTLTFSDNGRIFYGDIEVTFPFLRKTHPDIESSSRSNTIIDASGNTYTIVYSGKIYSSSSDGTPRWTVENIGTISLYSAISKDNLLYVPFMDSSKNGGLYIIDTDNGEIIKNVSLGGVKYPSAVSIGKDFIVCMNQGSDIYGSVTKLTKTGAIIKSVKTDYDSTFPPIIFDKNNIYALQEMLYNFNENLDIVWLSGFHNIYKIIYFNNMILTTGDYSQLYNAPGTPEGDWPQYLHDSMQSGSMEEIEFVDPPLAPVSVIPKDSAVFDTNSVTFSWQIDSGDPEIKYTLLLRDSTGYDKVYAGPEIGLSTATVNDLSSGSYEWRVVSKDKNGSLNVSDARTFEIK